MISISSVSETSLTIEGSLSLHIRIQRVLESNNSNDSYRPQKRKNGGVSNEVDPVNKKLSDRKRNN